MNRVFSTLLLLLFWGCNQYQPSPNTNIEPAPTFASLKKKPKNIILMIGDGMGLTQITAGMYRNGNKLNLEQFPVIGLHKPYAANDLITDSAASATAFACGKKTNNGAIGVDENMVPIKSILEEAEERGLSTGMVATSNITHATPAAFIAHVKSRSRFEDIAEDFLKTEIDFFIGGGKKYFDQRKKDNRNLYNELEDKGYFVSDYFKEPLTDIAVDFDKNFAYFTANSDPVPFHQGRKYLVPATKLATIFMSNHGDKGFFLMIESSQIDWGGHNNDSDYITSEMIEFDRSIGAVLDFAKEDEETLVIVTADHETGGFSINPGSTMEKILPGFTTKYHTAVMIPVFAYGPGSEIFGGIYENTSIYYKMKRALGFE